jgi:hypothetical protein
MVERKRQQEGCETPIYSLLLLLLHPLFLLDQHHQD